jgi:hypothetical protein
LLNVKFPPLNVTRASQLTGVAVGVGVEITADAAPPKQTTRPKLGVNRNASCTTLSRQAYTPPFGNPSVDCRMNGQLFGTIDILFNPATTGSTTLTAKLPCNNLGFNNKRCAGGANNHAVCTTASECPGGTCNQQCFCPNTPAGTNQRPTGCQDACFGGPDNAFPCTTDADCTPPGFCNPGDCRVNPGDTGSAQEGLCTVGPFDKSCSTHSFKTCSDDSGCQGAACPYCDPGETCIAPQRQCFVPPTIQRAGTTVGYVPITNQEHATAAIFCISASGSPAVDSVAGLPGPGAITQPARTIEVGFP